MLKIYIPHGLNFVVFMLPNRKHVKKTCTHICAFAVIKRLLPHCHTQRHVARMGESKMRAKFWSESLRPAGRSRHCWDSNVKMAVKSLSICVWTEVN